MKIIISAAIVLLASGHADARKRTPNPPDGRVLAVRKVYVTGRKRHQVEWARKHLGRFTCLQPVPEISQADGILDLEPVAAPPPVDYGDGPTGVVTCRSRNTGTTSAVACSDATGATEKIRCRTAANGESTCTS